MKKHCIIGSINMDMVTRVPRFSRPGETLQGASFQTVYGGKGANQAVALSRLGAHTAMAGCVGDDAFGAEYLRHFKDEGVDTSLVRVQPGVSTGVAPIQVADSGENSIVVVPGANGLCSPQYIEEIMPRLLEYDVFLLQFEIPFETVLFALRALKQAGKTIILDPAPARALPEEAFSLIDYVTPNATELKTITPELPESADVLTRMSALEKRGGCRVIHKSGGNGAFYLENGAHKNIPGYRVPVVDTVAAGDTFNAGLAAALSKDMPLEDALCFANAAAALAVTKEGAQGGMPTYEEALALMRGQNR